MADDVYQLRRIWGTTRFVGLFETQFGHHSFVWSFQSTPFPARVPLHNPRQFETHKQRWRHTYRVYPQNNTSPLQTPCFRPFQQHLAFVISLGDFFRSANAFVHLSSHYWCRMARVIARSLSINTSRSILTKRLDRCFDHCSQLFFCIAEVEMLQKMHHFMILVCHCREQLHIYFYPQTCFRGRWAGPR